MSDAVTTTEQTNVEDSKEQAKAVQDQLVQVTKQEPKQVLKRTRGNQAQCPACRHTVHSEIGGDYRQCASCHTAFIPGAASQPLVKSAGKISGLSNVSDLQSELATIIAGMKPGESIMVDAQLRVSEPFSESWDQSAYIAAGGFAIAAEAVGFAPVDTSAQPIVLTKPVPTNKE